MIAGFPVAFLTIPTIATAQETRARSGNMGITERCRSEAYRQFDFWQGTWEVRNPAGEIIGHNEIRPIATGCGLLENWRGVAGGRGVSVNTYDADRGKWTQRWIGAGAVLWLEGALDGTRMVLTGTAPRSTPRGAVLDRLTWTPLPDGRVRQVWDISADGGATWQRLFEGLYSAAPDL